MKLTASDIYTYYRPSKCGLRVYLDYKGIPLPPQSAWEQLLRIQSERHRQKHRETFSEVNDLSLLPRDQRLVKTIELIQGQSPLIFGGLLQGRIHLLGKEWLVYGEPDFLILENSNYILRNIHLANNMKEHPEIFRQLQLSAWLYKQRFHKHVTRLELVTGSNDIRVIAPNDSNILKTLKDIAWLKNQNGKEPYSPVSWSKCSSCGYQNRCWQKADQSRDISLISGIEKEWVFHLRNAGITTIDALQNTFNINTLTEFRPHGAPKKVGKKRARQILAFAHALSKQQPVWLRQPHIPFYSHYAMFDLEGIPYHFNQPNQVFLWGLQVFGNIAEPYQPAITSLDGSLDSDRICWEQFLDNATNILTRFGDIPFIHWGNYEHNRLTVYLERYGDRNGIGKRVQSLLLDLLPLLQQSVALPLPSYSLKIVEKYVGFQRRQEASGGDWAIAQYIQAVNGKNKQEQTHHMQQVLIYNQDDLTAMWEILKWIRQEWLKMPFSYTEH